MPRVPGCERRRRFPRMGQLMPRRQRERRTDPVAGGGACNALQDAQGIRHVPGLQIGGERWPVQRLDAETIAPEQQVTSGSIPVGESEHPAQPLHAPLAVLLVQVHEDLGIRARREAMPPGDELARELAIVVDLAIRRHPDGGVLVRHGLLAAREIDDAEPAHSHSQRARQVVAPAVRATVGQNLARPLSTAAAIGRSGLRLSAP